MPDERERTRAETAILRAAAIRRLAGLHARGELTGQHVALAAGVLQVHRRTVRRWIAASLATTAPSVHTVQRAIRRDLTRGDRAGLSKGERARRKHDVYLRRPPVHRNAVWEGDHVQAPVEVDVDGELRKPWITWFVDCGTNVLPGVAITPGYPSREAVLTALRACISCTGSFGPFGGLPGAIRIDRGKDFLSHAVADAMAYFGVRVGALPGYASYLKGRIEAVNGAAEDELFKLLPRYTGAQRLINNRPADPDAPPLTFEAFVAKVLGWIAERNTEHVMPALGGRTPAQAWDQDLTPIETVPDRDLVLYTLEDDGKPRPITTDGVYFAGQYYVGDCMVGRARGDKVRVRWMPNHPELIEIFDADTGAYMGPATPSGQAPSEHAAKLLKARARKAKQLVKDLKAAERARRVNYAAVTTAAPPQVLGTVSTLEAETELAEDRRADAAAIARPDLFPLPPAAPGWAMPRAAVSDPDGKQGGKHDS